MTCNFKTIKTVPVRRPYGTLTVILVFLEFLALIRLFPFDTRTMLLRCPCDVRQDIDRFLQIVLCAYGH